MGSLTSTLKSRWRLILVLAVVLPLLVLTLYTWTALHWDYSAGYRSGTMQKFSRKGWLCKTYEGELWQAVVQNVAPTVWLFTVRDESVVQALDTLVGRQVRLHYTEHRGVPTTCFGDTPYYVDSVTALTQ
jgi:predicted component of type VI protein secretion system